jgi:hypothetical protein
MTCVLQFSEPLRATNEEARRLCGDVDIGKTLFATSMIRNPIFHVLKKKHYNNCFLGNTYTSEDLLEVKAREDFFRWDWM